MHTIESTQSRTYIEQHIALQSEPTVCSLYCDTDINLAMSSSLRVAVGIENKGVISVPFFGKMKCLMLYPTVYFMTMSSAILGLQSISRDVAHNASHPRGLDPTMELIKYSFVLYLQHGRHDVKCKPSML